MKNTTPSRASKYEGFLKINAYGMPHPDWIFVNSPEQLGRFCEKDGEYGWTVRTCEKAAGKYLEINYPYINNLKKEEVSKWIQDKSRQFHESLIFVVYPSWEFDRSGNYLLLANEAIVEAIDGFLGDLTGGRSNPKVTLKFDRYSRQLVSSHGDKAFLGNEEIGQILKYNSIIIEANVVNEWSITKKGELFFHHWIEF